MDAHLYDDDVNAGSKAEKVDLVSLREILTTLFTKRFSFRFSKCAFNRLGVEVFWHSVSLSEGSPSAGLVMAIQDLKEPASGEKLMCYL